LVHGTFGAPHNDTHVLARLSGGADLRPMRWWEVADDEDPPPALSDRDHESDTQQRPEHRDDHTEQQEAPGRCSRPAA